MSQVVLVKRAGLEDCGYGEKAMYNIACWGNGGEVCVVTTYPKLRVERL